MFVKAENTLSEFYVDIIKDELNVKNVEFKDELRDFTSYSFKPQLKTVGPKFGKQLGLIKNALSTLDGNTAMDEINETGKLKLTLSDGSQVELLKEDLLIDMAQVEGYVSDGDNKVTVVLDTKLTPQLIEEGFVREITSKIQTMRKEAGFEVTDKITVYIKDNEKIAELVLKNSQSIKSDVLAREIIEGSSDGYEKQWNINGEDVVIAVKKN
jgi:isoleucyl-tRNA synthetase